MLRPLIKQLWLVVLMVFVIGWSGVSVASAKSMHLDTTSQQMSVHCQEMAKVGNSHPKHQAEHSSPHDLSQKMECPSDLNKLKDDCPDCIYTSCHSLISWIDVEIPELALPETHTHETILLPNYQAKHLAGYWQEILRPPKA